MLPTISGAFEAKVARSACASGLNCCVCARPGGGPGSSRGRGTWTGLVVSWVGLKNRM